MRHAGNVRKVFPIWPDVRDIVPPRPRALTGKPLGETHGLLTVDGDALISRARMGTGDLYLLACPEIFQNGHIGEADHLRLLLSLAGEGRPVYFDEFAHGVSAKAGVTEILRQWGFGPFLLILAIGALALFWRLRVRIGPEEDGHREERIEAIDFVDSLALLYDRTLRRREAIALYVKAFEQALAVQTGLRGKALEEKVREFIPRSVPTRPVRGRDISMQEFHAGRKSVNQAFRRLEDAKRPGSRGKAPGAQ